MKLPQLSLRDLFWLVLVAALTCAWWVERQRPEPIPAAPVQVGRFKLIIDKKDRQIMHDTASGECWIYDDWNAKWNRRRPPVPTK